MGFFGRRLWHNVKRFGKHITSSKFLKGAGRTLGKINKYALPVLGVASAIPVFGEVAAGLSTGLKFAEKGLNSADKVKGVYDKVKGILQPSMGRSIGSSQSVESFHTPTSGNMEMGMESGITKGLRGVAQTAMKKIMTDDISGVAAKRLQTALQSRISDAL